MAEDHYRADLSGSRFEEVDFSGSWFRNVYFTDVVMRGAWLENLDVDGELRNVTINGVDVGPLVEAELDRRDPDRVLVRAQTADDFRAGWAMVERRWAATVEQARALPEELLQERVRDEWSFLETLRHLVFATDAWVLRVVLGEPKPYYRFGVLHTEHEGEVPGVVRDPDPEPTLDEVLAERESRFAVVREVMAGLTDERLDEMTEPVTEPGYPESESFLVRRALGAILNEEWSHRVYAERDLAVLASRT
ncbi:DinB family protein [Nocardioides sp.]|uniref:DinB family protein n=1 Tax=Nocardioides sp. TaxID=35761 RepID=UPI0037847BDD